MIVYAFHIATAVLAWRKYHHYLSAVVDRCFSVCHPGGLSQCATLSDCIFSSGRNQHCKHCTRHLCWKKNSIFRVLLYISIKPFTEHTLSLYTLHIGEVRVCIDTVLQSFGLSFGLLAVMYLKRKRIHPLCNKTVFLLMLQNIFHAVVEVPRWTNAKMEVRIQLITVFVYYLRS